MKINELKTPVYVVDENALIKNLEILQNVENETGCKILLAQKAFSMFNVYPLISKYISGCTASGLYEAMLSFEEMKKENHVFSPAYEEDEMVKLCEICDHISFNSINQLELFREIWENSNISVGLRINPEHSTQEGHIIYDPCAKGSRLGITKSNFPKTLPKGVEGLHFHTLCEQDALPLVETFKVVEEKFGEYLTQIKWLNLGGGHHITRSDYNLDMLKDLIKYIKLKYNVEVYLEPGEAIALNAGYLVTRVMDIVYNDLPILILDASASCHMPDVLEMPYRPPLQNSGMPNEKIYTCRLSSRTCLAGDVIGDYSFDKMPKINDKLIFEDMAIYSMVKNNTFNGIPLPNIALMDKYGKCKVIKSFTYQDFKGRLS